MVSVNKQQHLKARTRILNLYGLETQSKGNRFIAQPYLAILRAIDPFSVLLHAGTTK